MSDNRAIIVGGGVAGLSAASALAEAGIRVTLVEGETFFGGRMSTKGEVQFEHEEKRYTFPSDHGVHGVWRQYRNLRRLMSDHGLGTDLVDAGQQELITPSDDGDELVTLEVGARLRETVLPDVLMPAALLKHRHILKTLARAGTSKTASIARKLFHGLAFDPQTEIERYDHLDVHAMIGDWPPLVQRLFSALTHSAFFRDPSEVSLSAFFTGLWCYVYGDKRDTAFSFFSDGAQRALVGPILDRIVERGGELRSGTRLEEIEFEDGRFTAAHVRQGDKWSLIHGDALVLAVDPPGFRALSSQLDDALEPGIRIPDGLPSSSARLWFSAARAPERALCGVFADLPADGFFWLDEMHEPFRAWRRSTGGSVVEFQLYGDRAEWAERADDEEIVDRLRALSLRTWPELGSSFVHGHVERNARTQVAFGPGVMSKLPAVETKLPNLALAGDWIQTPWPTLYLERASLTGLLAARQVAPSLGVHPDKLAEPLPPYPRAENVMTAHKILRRLRERGLLGTLD